MRARRPDWFTRHRTAEQRPHDRDVRTTSTTAAASDEAQLKAIADGDRPALRTLYERHAPINDRGETAGFPTRSDPYSAVGGRLAGRRSAQARQARAAVEVMVRTAFHVFQGSS
jgi:hypothetical protein